MEYLLPNILRILNNKFGNNLKYIEGPLAYAILIAICVAIILYFYFRKYEKNNTELQNGLDVVRNDASRFMKVVVGVVVGAILFILIFKFIYLAVA